MDNVDKIKYTDSFNKTQGFTLPKGTLTILPPHREYLPTLAFSFGEAFHTDDPRIGTGSGQPTGRLARAWPLELAKSRMGSRPSR